jgi:NitT/TauT family transport system permease protein
MVKLGDLLTGTNGNPHIWQYLWPTVSASLMGLVIGVAVGAFLGLLLGGSRFLSETFRPFVVAANAVPRIALIPIIVILVGPNFQAAVIVSFLVVFFVSFFNAYEGSRTVPLHVLQNATVMGFGGWNLMWHIRMPYALAWTLAALPLAATFGLLSVVTGELLTGTVGMGRLLMVASASSDSTLTFAVVVVLSVLGVSLVGLIARAQRRAMHWWVPS